ncbi:MAG: sugar phosphate isomerase/epimerase, partial [Clostridia bacterium]|nr:sugar phosphate isomerase/epimerase [Clostridia bacterium]
FDPANFVQSGVDTKEAFNKLYPYIEYMHIKDSLKDGLVVPAGEGDGNVEYILKELFAKGYDGFLSLEPHLGTFVGLQNLELDDKMLNLEKASESTFAIALSALEKILNRM